MNILSLDTTMQACSAAVLRDAKGAADLFCSLELMERGHAEAIMPMIEEVIGKAGIAYDALDRIAVTTGPGTFTGVRVGIATARGLALATGARMVGVTSLAVIAADVLADCDDRSDQTLAIATDARRGQLYFAMFDRAGRALCDHMALSAQEAAGLLPSSGDVLIAGSGAELLRSAAVATGRGPTIYAPDIQPDAGRLAHMAIHREPDTAPPGPLYLRAPDAKPQSHKSIPHL
jgi:tRNA threonylcarbamoyl adenosine modification protein YeaZ